MRLLFSQLVNKLLFPHMASLLHIQTQRWVKSFILTLLFPHCLFGTFWLMSLSQAHTDARICIVLIFKKCLFFVFGKFVAWLDLTVNPFLFFWEADEPSCHFLTSTLQLLVLCLASAEMSGHVFIKCLPHRRNLKKETVGQLRNALKRK